MKDHLPTHLPDEWPYPDVEGDSLHNAVLMQQWWDSDQAQWRELKGAPSHEEHLLDGVILPEWALAQEGRTR